MIRETARRHFAGVILVAILSPLAGAVQSVSAQQPAWSVETPTGPERPITFEATQGTWMSLAISPDGRYLAFDLLGHIYEMPIGGGAARQLTGGRSWNLMPRYSPDGQIIAFSSDRTGSHGIWLMDRQGGNLRSLYTPGDNTYRAVWAPDGQSLLTANSSGLATIDLRGNRTSLIRGPGTINAGAFEPDGAGILFERLARPVYPFGFNPYFTPAGGSTIEQLDLPSGQTATLIQRPGGAFAPTLSPDGTLLAYLNRHIDTTRIILRNLFTHRERVLPGAVDPDRQSSRSGYGPYPAMAWHPDGRRLFLNTGGQIVSVDVTTGTRTTIPFRATIDRQASSTIRFASKEPDRTAKTRTHRWGTRTPQGILFEALGDLWMQDAKGVARNLTSSPAHETSPTVDPRTGALYYASWSDDSLGAVYRIAKPGARPERLTTIPAQYGSIAIAPQSDAIAFVRGADGVEHGTLLSNEGEFDLVLRRESGTEQRVAGISTQPLVYADIAGKIPPSVSFTADGQRLIFTEFERDTLVLKQIGIDGENESVLAKFPNGVAAVPSPDLSQIALREYQRSFITPFPTGGEPVVVSPYEGIGTSARVDAEDGGYLTWSGDGRTLAWTRGTGFYEKAVSRILADQANPPATSTTAEAWNGARVPGSTAQRTETALELTVAAPTGITALTGARVVTMNGMRQIIENATILINGNRITAVGAGLTIPSNAKVHDLAGTTIIPGLIDAHAHPHIEHSALHVIEQQPTYLSGPLAYGVTTMVEVYGNEYRDGWLSDMLRTGQITGPRLFTTGSIIFGQRRSFRARMFRPIETLHDALEQTRWNKDHGAIAVKDYAQDTRKRRQLTITAARMIGLNVVSESNAEPQMNLTQILDGVTGIEHSMGLAPFYDDITKFWGATAAGNTPTLLVVYNGAMGEGWYHQATKLWEDPKLTRFLTPEHLMRLRNTTHLRSDDMFAWRMGAAVKQLFDNGTSVQLGAHGQLYGIDTHFELDLLVRSGFTPAQALEVGTIRGAWYHGLDRDLGSLEAGKLADLVILDANPLADIANAQKIRFVMKNGVLYDGTNAARIWPDPKPAAVPYFAPRP